MAECGRDIKTVPLLGHTALLKWLAWLEDFQADLLKLL
jgi:hypothetical protein